MGCCLKQGSLAIISEKNNDAGPKLAIQANESEIKMIGGCPHYDIKAYCQRLNRTCRPAMKGCVLESKVRRLKSDIKGEHMSARIETLDLRHLPPHERHAKIFQTWNLLESGETMKIINDHDPKPLRYQFEAEQDGKFQWEYEKEGPVDWIVNVKRI